jgi:hypothetical protein
MKIKKKIIFTDKVQGFLNILCHTNNIHKIFLFLISVYFILLIFVVPYVRLGN